MARCGSNSSIQRPVPPSLRAYLPASCLPASCLPACLPATTALSEAQEQALGHASPQRDPSHAPCPALSCLSPVSSPPPCQTPAQPAPTPCCRDAAIWTHRVTRACHAHVHVAMTRAWHGTHPSTTSADPVPSHVHDLRLDALAAGSLLGRSFQTLLVVWEEHRLNQLHL